MRKSRQQRGLPEEKRQFVGHLVSLWICVSLAAVFFWIHYSLSKQTFPIFWELSLHIAISFLVSATVIGVIEIRAHKIGVQETQKFRDLVSKDVFQALLGRIVPNEVFHEINDILHSNFVRRSCKYRIIFKKPYAGMNPGYFVMRREVTYRLENLLNREAKFPISSSHSEDLDLEATGWTHDFHQALFIDEKTVPLKKGDDFKGDVNVVMRGSTSQLRHEITLGPRDSREITIHSEEPTPVRAGRNTYLQATPVIGLEVEILNNFDEAIGKSEVQMNHPQAAKARTNHIGSVILEKAFLPGQGFQVVWMQELVKKEEEAA